MSSTGRSAEQRRAHDYYATPHAPIREFLTAWLQDDADAKDAITWGPILDPCAGGNMESVKWTPGKTELVALPTPMSYQLALKEFTAADVFTRDIRTDSLAENHGDFLLSDDTGARVIITNPPFALAMEIIEHALKLVQPEGFVVSLLRLNFFESVARFPFFQRTPPQRCYVHHKRICFTQDGHVDSVAYAHFVWRKGADNTSTILRVI